MERAFSRRQDLTIRLLAIPIASIVAAHVVFAGQFPWQLGYEFPLAYFLTVATVMFWCWEVNIRLFLWLDVQLPFHLNPSQRIARQILFNGLATLLTFSLVFPLAQLCYVGRLPALSLLLKGAVVCATIATIVNSAYIAFYLLKTVYWQRAQSVMGKELFAGVSEQSVKVPRLVRIELCNGELLLLPSEIAYFYSTGGVVLLVKTDGGKVTTGYRSLTELTEQLGTEYFFGLNRQIVAGLGAVRAVKDDVNRKLIVSLVPPLHQHRSAEEVAVSRYRSAAFRTWLQTAATR